MYDEQYGINRTTRNRNSYPGDEQDLGSAPPLTSGNPNYRQTQKPITLRDALIRAAVGMIPVFGPAYQNMKRQQSIGAVPGATPSTTPGTVPPTQGQPDNSLLGNVKSYLMKRFIPGM